MKKKLLAFISSNSDFDFIKVDNIKNEYSLCRLKPSLEHIERILDDINKAGLEVIGWETRHASTMFGCNEWFAYILTTKLLSK